MAGERIVFWDTETTGLSPEDGDRIVEMGFVETDAALARTGRTLHFYVNPLGRPVGESKEIHGLSDAFLAAQEPFSNHVDEALDFLDGARIVAHNSEFDLGFFMAELTALGRTPSWTVSEDTLPMARRLFPGQPASLDALAKRLGLDASARAKHHGALIDSDLLVEVYAHLTGRTSLGLTHVQAVVSEMMPTWAMQDWFVRRSVFLPQEDELARHLGAYPCETYAPWTALRHEWELVPTPEGAMPGIEGIA